MKGGENLLRCACEMVDVLHCNSYKKLTIMKMELVQQRGLKNKRKRGWVIKAHVLHSFCPSFVFYIILHGLKWSSQGCMLTITHSSYTFTCTYISIHLYIVCAYF